MKDAKLLLFHYSMVLAIYLVHYVIGKIYPVRWNHTVYYWSGACVIFLYLGGYLLYSWKSNMAELLKRVRLAIPFVLIVSIFTIIMGLGNRAGISAGLSTFILLLLKTANRKQHFSVIMALALASVIFLRLLLIWSADGGQMTYPLLRAALLFTCYMPILIFFLIYSAKIVDAEIVDLKMILVRSIKFSVAFGIYFTVFLILSDFGDERGISLPIQILATSLLTIFFAGICYRFDLFPVERKKKPKNRINELHEELEEFYIEERARIKKER